MSHKNFLIGVIIIATIFINISIIVCAQPDNESWGIDHWGDDTGEEYYTEPLEPPPVEETRGACSMSIIVCSILFIHGITRRFCYA